MLYVRMQLNKGVEETSDLIKRSQRASFKLPKGELREDRVETHPHAQFLLWFNHALEAQLHEPYAMSLATVSGRVVRMSEQYCYVVQPEAGYDFYTNYDSQKAMIWQKTHMQSYCSIGRAGTSIRIGGKVVKISEAESTDYYHKRPRDSQIAAHIVHHKVV